jgi:hypothetical protein
LAPKAPLAHQAQAELRVQHQTTTKTSSQTKSLANLKNGNILKSTLIGLNPRQSH